MRPQHAVCADYYMHLIRVVLDAFEAYLDPFYRKAHIFTAMEQASCALESSGIHPTDGDRSHFVNAMREAEKAAMAGNRKECLGQVLEFMAVFECIIDRAAEMERRVA